MDAIRTAVGINHGLVMVSLPVTSVTYFHTVRPSVLSLDQRSAKSSDESGSMERETNDLACCNLKRTHGQ